MEEVERHARDFPPERQARATGIEADAIRRMARELAAAPRAVYGRIDTTTQEFGAHLLAGRLPIASRATSTAGGVMFPRAAAGARNEGEPGRGRGVKIGRWTSRVSGAA